MSSQSSIEWTDATWNPVRGCTKASAGCKPSYYPYEQGFGLRLLPEKLLDPLTWRRSRRIFVNSMSDLFHEGVPDEYIAAALDVMRLADWHIYQVLTSRADRMLSVTRKHRDLEGLDHIWLGVSAENRKHGLPRIERLRETRAAIRFLSIEPLLEDLGEIDLRGIDWVIVGGESGPGARPMEESWVVSIREQCKEADVPFFFKQWGGVRKSRNGRHLEGSTYDEFPRITPPSPPSAAELRRRRKIARSGLPVRSSVLEGLP